ncbi:MAG: hypothetical protein WBI74_10935 [Caldicoprobacterales bacterium]|nr:hypothetical protein [Clostridiales bacterium]
MNTLLRLLYYILTRLTALAVIIILIILAAFIGFDWANINVIVNEGLTERAEVVLTDQEPTELNKFYTQEYLDRDPLLSINPYENFIINDYDHRIKIKKLWVWPWQNETRVIVEEVITGIDGSTKNEDSDEKTVPTWENGEKILVMEKDGRWRISNVILIRPIEIEPEIENNVEQDQDEPEGQNEGNQEEQVEDGQEGQLEENQEEQQEEGQE